MGMVKNEDIKGYRVGEDVVCPDCMKPEEIRAIKQNELILLRELEDQENIYWCDRCGKLIE